MKKLFRVTATWYIAADDENEAAYIQPDLTASDVDAEEVTDAGEIDYNWTNCFPFGDTDGLICKEYVETPETPESKEALPEFLFPELDQPK